MEIQYELTEEDVVAFNLYHVKNSKVGKIHCSGNATYRL